MTPPSERPKKRRTAPKADLQKPTHPEGEPGHPAPKPPPDARQPEASVPRAPLENVMADHARTLAPTTAGGKMGPTNSAPQVPAQTPETNPVGMTQPPEEPDDADGARVAPPARRTGKPPKKR